MSLDQIRQAILAEARAEAQETEADARRRHDERLQAARQALKEEFAKRLDQARQGAEQDSDRQVMRRRAEHNLSLLRQRNAILDELFNEAARRLADLPDTDYRAVIEHWMEKVPGQVGGDVLCNERDEKRLAPLLKELNASRPPEAQLRLVRHSEPILGGILFRAERFEVVLTMEARLQKVREALAPEVSAVVFSGDVSL